MTTANKIRDAINEFTKFIVDNEINPKMFNKNEGKAQSFKQFYYDKKLNEIIDRILSEEEFIDTRTVDELPIPVWSFN